MKKSVLFFLLLMFGCARPSKYDGTTQRWTWVEPTDGGYCVAYGDFCLTKEMPLHDAEVYSDILNKTLADARSKEVRRERN